MSGSEDRIIEHINPREISLDKEPNAFGETVHVERPHGHGDCWCGVTHAAVEEILDETKEPGLLGVRPSRQFKFFRNEFPAIFRFNGKLYKEDPDGWIEINESEAMYFLKSK